MGSATQAEPVAIALIDLDRFREINDALGQRSGDRLLVELTARLQKQLGVGDTLARVGGDEFGIILKHGATAHETLTALRRTMGELVVLDGLPLTVEASVGYAVAPHDGSSADLLLLRADLAMVTAKRQHLGVTRYSSDQDSYDSSALALLAELATAIAEDQLVLHYQPKGDVGAATVTGLEALVRWQHPKRGLLYPDAFLPLAEQTELIDDLTRWVLRSACRDLAGIDPTGRLSVAVNISARSLGVPDFAEHVLDILRETGTPPSRIIAEITETALLTDPPAASRTLSRLNDAGMRISIDDFGAGQTSLSYLATLPVSELKIDRAFVWSAADDARSAALVRSIVELGHNLGLTVTAEGVETAPMLEYLAGVRCDTVQGYLLAKPVAPERMDDALAQAHEALAANFAVRAARVA
jgi:diguanylate cyclase